MGAGGRTRLDARSRAESEVCPHSALSKAAQHVQARRAAPVVGCGSVVFFQLLFCGGLYGG